MTWSIFIASAVLWIGLLALMIGDGDRVDRLWSWVQGRPAPLRTTLWIVFLPWMASLAVWYSPWALWVRWVVIVGTASTALFLFYPRAR